MNWWDENAKPFLQHPEVAGALGSMMSLRWVPGANWLSRAFAFGTGFGLAIYCSPWAVELMQIKSAYGPPAFGFLAGLLGMNITAKVVEAVKHGDWFTFLTSFFPGRKQ